MKDRLGPPSGTVVNAVAGPPGANPEAEAFGALVALGYKPAEATRLLKASRVPVHIPLKS